MPKLCVRRQAVFLVKSFPIGTDFGLFDEVAGPSRV